MNVLYDRLPAHYEGYRVNMDFQIGIQVSCVFYDSDLSEEEKNRTIIELLFGEEYPDSNGFSKDIIREYPEDIEDCITWFMAGWNHDNKTSESQGRSMDYHKDQWRIYADFWRNYRIDLNTAEMHWWVFQGLLWNMGADTSALYNAINIRTKKIGEKYSERDANRQLRDAKRQLAIEDAMGAVKEYTAEENANIDLFDQIMG